VGFINTDFGNRDGLHTKVALHKGRDTTHFDGQTSDDLSCGTDSHWQRQAKTSRKETHTWNEMMLMVSAFVFCK